MDIILEKIRAILYGASRIDNSQELSIAVHRVLAIINRIEEEEDNGNNKSDISSIGDNNLRNDVDGISPGQRDIS
jgi:hypothetical protein